MLFVCVAGPPCCCLQFWIKRSRENCSPTPLTPSSENEVTSSEEGDGGRGNALSPSALDKAFKGEL